MKAPFTVVRRMLIALFFATASFAAHADGTSFQIQGKSYAQIWKACVHAMSTNLSISESDQATGHIASSSGVGVATWGENVELMITPAKPGAASYTINVVSHKRLRMQITGTNWEPTVAANIQADLQ